MKKTKKNNKGFSLVELIVVVLIMAIIAVALAPQVMKWVGSSRTSTDAQTYDTLVSNLQLALADENALAEVKAKSVKFTIAAGGVTTTPASLTADHPNLETQIKNICGTSWASNIKKKDTAQSVAQYEITIKTDGTVDRTVAPDTSGVK